MVDAETIAVGTATVANIHTDKKVADAFFFMFLTPFIHLFKNISILSTITLYTIAIKNLVSIFGISFLYIGKFDREMGSIFAIMIY